MSWSPTRPEENPFVMVGTPNYVGGRFEERQRLVDWVNSSERSPLLLAGVRGAGKTTLTAWLNDYLEFDPHGHFTESAAPTPVFVRGNRSDSLLDQLLTPRDTTVTSEIGGGVLGLRGRREESSRVASPPSLLELMPSGYLVVVDEAQSLSHDQLVEIAEFLERPGSAYSGKVLMAGTPELLRIHPSDGTFGLFGRCQTVTLAATQSYDETADTLYGTAALGDKRFSSDAVELIHDLTGGYPTAVQIAAHFAYRSAREQVDAEHVNLSPGSPGGQQLARVFDQMIRRQGARGRQPHLRTAVLRVLADGAATAQAIADATRKSDAKGVAPALDHLHRSGLVAPAADHRWRIAVPLLGRHLTGHE